MHWLASPKRKILRKIPGSKIPGEPKGWSPDSDLRAAKAPVSQPSRDGKRAKNRLHMAFTPEKEGRARGLSQD